MATANLKDQEKLQEEKREERVSAIEEFFNKNGKWVWGTLAALILIGLIILCYNKFIVQPKQAEAQEQMFPAEASFRNGEYELALKGDGNTLGFEQVISDYGKRAGKAVYLYAGICEQQLGNYENALNYLKKYDGKDAILAARALSCQGDAYVGLEQYEQAVSCYDKAAAKADDVFAASYLLKAGVVCEELGNTEKALSYYKKVKDQYPNSVEGTDIDKYISRIESAQTK